MAKIPFLSSSGQLKIHDLQIDQVSRPHRPGRAAVRAHRLGKCMVGAFKPLDSEATQKASGTHWKVEAFLVRNIWQWVKTLYPW